MEGEDEDEERILLETARLDFISDRLDEDYSVSEAEDLAAEYFDDCESITCSEPVVEVDDPDLDALHQFGGARIPAPVTVSLEEEGDVDLRAQWHEYSPRFNARALHMRFVPSDSLRDEELERFQSLDRAIRGVYDFLKDSEDIHDEDYLQVHVSSSKLSGGDLVAPIVPAAEASPDILVSEIQKVIQSNQEVAVDDGSFTMTVQHVRMPRGAGYEDQRQKCLSTFTTVTQDILKKCRSLTEIPRDLHPFCGVACLVIGKLLVEKKINVGRRFARRKRALRRQCRILCRRAGIPCSMGVSLAGIEAICQLDEFSDFYVTVFSTRTHLTPIAKFNREAEGGHIQILLDHTNHFTLISKINAFLGKSGVYCPDCERFFTGVQTKHQCDRKLCKQCKTNCGSTKKDFVCTGMIHCTACGRYFFGQNCFDAHQVRGLSPNFSRKTIVCQSFVACPRCNRDLKAKDGVSTGKNAYEQNSDHECFRHKCRNCYQIVDMSTHECYIRPINPTKGKAKERYVDARGELWFFDMETTVEEDSDGKKFFEVNLICLMHESGLPFVCFGGEDALKDFCVYCVSGEDSLMHRQIPQRLFAHNMARFDGKFVIQMLTDYCHTSPQIVFDGLDPIMIRIHNLFFCDSFRYVSTSLDQFGKQFGLEVSKGFFPHEFNLKCNYDYEGDLPSSDMYGTKFMTDKKYQDFMKWWKEEDAAIRSGSKPKWNFLDEIISYCKQDVEVLRKAWLAYEKSAFELTGFYPGVANYTLAKLANLAWKKDLETMHVPLLRRDGYVHHDQQSQVAFDWLTWLDLFYFAGELQYSGKDGRGEKRIILDRVWKVDGYHQPTKTVFEFAGCAFHGCNTCTHPHMRSVFCNATNRDLRSQFQNRIGKLISNGYQVEVMWECEWSKLCKDPQVVEQLQEISGFRELPKPLNPRDALFGGRTEVFAMDFDRERQPGHVLDVDDVISLYPSRNKYGDYPIGHPKVFFGNSQRFDFSLDAYQGIMSCSILPPRGLYLPVLPCRIDVAKNVHKLMFVLCAKCAAEFEQGKCCHVDEERVLHGTWDTIEVYAAMRRGYKLLAISCVWHFENVRNGLFANYVDKFFKVKAEASGYPAGCDTEAQKADYVRRVREREGVELDPANICKNPGARAVAKGALNSLWGKFAQNPNRTWAEVTHSAAKFFQMIADPTKQNKSFYFLNSETVLLRARKDSKYVGQDTNGCVIHAIRTTALARLFLLEQLERLGRKVFYCDTDSAYYLLADGEGTPLERGEFLGQMSRELEPRESITRFVALGPKNYGYEVFDWDREEKSKVVCKIRGLTANRATARVVNFSKMRSMVEVCRREKTFVDSCEEPITRFSITRGRNCFSLHPEIQQKRYGIVNDKRVVDWEDVNLRTYPYGY